MIRSKYGTFKNRSEFAKYLRDNKIWQIKEITPGYRKKMSEACSGEKNGMFGKHQTKKAKQKSRKAMLGKHWKQTEETKQRRRGRPSNSKGILWTEKAKQQKSEWHINHPNKKFTNTKIEQKIAAELTKRGIYYQQNIGLCNIANVDFYLPKHRIVIQADGDYWHNLPGRKESDTTQDKVLSINGFNVYRFWEHEINGSPEECINKIKI